MLTEVQLLNRATGIGGSDAGTIAGLNPYKTKFELYLEKRGEVEADDLSDNEKVHFGNVLEDVVAQEYARRMGYKVRRNNRTLRHPEHSFMIAHLDREVVGESRILECKTADKFTLFSDAWGPTGTDIVPESYLLQVQHYLAVTGKQYADLAVLIGGNEFRIYHLPRDEQLIADLINMEREFWQCVVDGTPPVADSAREAKAQWPNSEEGKALHCDDDILEAVLELKNIKNQMKVLEKSEKELRDLLDPIIRDHEALIHEGKIIATYKTSYRTIFDSKALAEDKPELYDEYLKKTESRSLLLKVK